MPNGPYTIFNANGVIVPEIQKKIPKWSTILKAL